MIPKLRLLSFFIGALALIFAGVGVQTAYAAPVRMIINEFYRGGNLETGDEWVEILLVEDLTDTQLNTFFIGDSTAATASKFTGFQFTNMGTIATNFPKGTIIVVGGTTALTQDTSYNPGGGDWNILLTIGGGFFTEVSTPVGNTADFAGTDVVYVDTNGTTGDTTISSDGFAVNYDSTPGTLGANSNVTIAVPGNNTGAVLNSDLAGATTPANWTVGVLVGGLTQGQPNGGTNTTYINSLRTPVDTAPSVLSTTPTNTATGVLIGSTITIDFSELVDVSAGGVTLECPVPTTVTFTGLPANDVDPLVLTPSSSLPYGTVCTVTVIAANVTDNDGTPDNMASNYAFTFTTEALVDTTPPTVTSTIPTNTATGVLIGSTITINFSELVDIIAGGVTVECPVATPITFTGLPANDVSSLVLTPSSSLPYGTVCTITVLAGNVTDNATTPNSMASNYTFTFTTESAIVITRIHDVQGNGNASPIAGATVTVEAIVIGDYQGPSASELQGFFLQEEDADVDADPATSEGIFIFCSACPTNVAVGDRVRVTGTVSEFFNMTQITATTAGSVVIQTSSNPMPTATTIDLPVTAPDINAFYEQFEGMLVTFSDALTVSEYFELARFGQIILYEGGRPYQFTHTNLPSVAGYTTHLDTLARHEVILDDLNNTQNAPLPAGVFYHPQTGGFGTGTQGINYFRGGDTVSNLTGILHWSWAGFGADAWRIRPVPYAVPTFAPVNTRPAAPTVTGDVLVASFNVLNYFTTIDTTTSNSVGNCGPSATLDCRGADSANELTQQTDKLVDALSAIDADIFGFMEIENSNNSTTLAAVVTALNTVVGAGTYDYINTGFVGTDAITTAFIYKPAIVQPVGGFLTDGDPVHDRPPLAVLFEVVEVGNPSFGEQFYVVVNHFKSKSSSAGLPGDADAGDGQGQSNATRVLQATRLLTWIGTTLTADPDVLIIGDLNSNRLEDPIRTLETGGFTNLVHTFGGATAYSYVFDGQLGYLDHALANASLLPFVTGTTEWHINADEVPVFDYNNYVDDGAGESSFEAKPTGNNLYEANAFRTSDHDPVIIGLAFPQPAPIVTNVVNIANSLASTNPVAPAVINVTVGTIDVTFSMQVQSGSAGVDDADNLDNYIVLAEGSVAGFQTTGTNACVTGVNAGDTEIIPTGITHNTGTYTTTLTFATPLNVGKYSLIVCGSTSIVNLFGTPLNNGVDVQYYFDIVISNNNGGGNNGGGNNNGGTTPVLTQDQLAEAVKAMPATGETPLWADTLRTGLVIGIIALFTLGLGFIILRRRTAR